MYCCGLAQGTIASGKMPLCSTRCKQHRPSHGHWPTSRGSRLPSIMQLSTYIFEHLIKFGQYRYTWAYSFLLERTKIRKVCCEADMYFMVKNTCGIINQGGHWSRTKNHYKRNAEDVSQASYNSNFAEGVCVFELFNTRLYLCSWEMEEHTVITHLIRSTTIIPSREMTAMAQFFYIYLPKKRLTESQGHFSGGSCQGVFLLPFFKICTTTPSHNGPTLANDFKGHWTSTAKQTCVLLY